MADTPNYEVTTTEDSTGPKISFGIATNRTEFFEIGSYNNANNIDTKDRPLGLLNIPKASTAPDIEDLEILVRDKNTGYVYTATLNLNVTLS